MNEFFTDLIYVSALFLICFAVSFTALSLLKSKKRTQKKPRRAAKKQSVYYISTEPKPKPVEPIAIKGTLLSREELDKLLSVRNDEQK